jgi:hypothetical protein
MERYRHRLVTPLPTYAQPIHCLATLSPWQNLVYPDTEIESAVAAVSYRQGRSEAMVGAALGSLIKVGSISREMLFIGTKAGFFSGDARLPLFAVTA